mmetsp:Transcript_26468/g.67220  ORF Transcript_26468/g.67220 Transcript_26468/m.67220 type:complete len:250 (+) Transcript_26468:1254-2003(+)
MSGVEVELHRIRRWQPLEHLKLGRFDSGIVLLEQTTRIVRLWAQRKVKEPNLIGYAIADGPVLPSFVTSCVKASHFTDHHRGPRHLAHKIESCLPDCRHIVGEVQLGKVALSIHRWAVSMRAINQFALIIEDDWFLLHTCEVLSPPDAVSSIVHTGCAGRVPDTLDEYEEPCALGEHVIAEATSSKPPVILFTAVLSPRRCVGLILEIHCKKIPLLAHALGDLSPRFLDPLLCHPLVVPKTFAWPRVRV